MEWMQGLPIPAELLRRAMLVAGSALMAVFLAQMAQRFSLATLLGGGPARALARYSAVAPVKTVQSAEDVYEAIGMTPPKHALAMQAGAGLATVAVLYGMGYPWPLGVGAGALAALLLRSFLNQQRTKARVRVEQELPGFMSEVAGQLMVTSSARMAIEEVIRGMRAESPLRAWMEYVLAGYNREGVKFLEQARQEAVAITPQMGVVMYGIQRLAETGGGDFTEAFMTMADRLSAILEARAVAGSKAESARTAVLMLIEIMAFVMVTIFNAETIRQGFSYPVVQVASIICVGLMGFGYAFMSGMIDEAMEG